MFGEDLDEQKDIKNYLVKSIKENKLSQSYIFESPNIEDSYKMAISFAKAIFCDNFEEEACDKCETCKNIENLNHPDLHIYESDKNIIKRESIDDLIKKAYTKSYYKGKKIFIIKEAEKMNLSASNTLLKTLEEPVSDVVIILLVKNITTLIATITSRCQIIKFKTEELNKIYDIEKEDSRSQYFDMFKKIIHGDALLIYDLEKYFDKEKDNINIILDLFELFLRDIAYLIVSEDAKIVNSDKLREMKDLADILSISRVSRIMDGLSQLKQDVKRNVNYRFITDSLVFMIQEEN